MSVCPSVCVCVLLFFWCGCVSVFVGAVSLTATDVRYLPASPAKIQEFSKFGAIKSGGKVKCQDNVFVQLICTIQYRVVKENADDAFYELQNPQQQIQAYVFDDYGYNIEHILMVDIIPDAAVLKAMNDINADMLSYQSDNDHSRLPSPTSMKPTIRGEVGVACRLRVHVYMLEMPRRQIGLKGDLCLNYAAFVEI
ncbi:unnamed protein product [Miscanthus lutarioriparius]|uniref:Uncharacterized protein n=1 Tax=Miscanthus lutarioriparius TaxID=422564 RepID=A0A811MYW3_9POAL|nr:unnamed protein product [Miscanthus lutarioriparius]